MSRNLQQTRGATVAAMGSGALNAAALTSALLKEVVVTAMTPTMDCPQAKLQGGSTAPSINKQSD